MDQVGNLLDRPRLYYNIDGLGELGGGLMGSGSALILWLLAHSPASSIWHQISWFAFLGLALVIHYGTKAIKTHITYPRTGFVEYRKGERIRTQIIAGVVGALTGFCIVSSLERHLDITTAASLAGLLFAVSYAYHIARAVRWKWVIVGAIAVASLVIARLPADVLAALANDSLLTHPARAKLVGVIILSLMTYGTMLLISGGISFGLYLHHTQAPAREGQ